MLLLFALWFVSCGFSFMIASRKEIFETVDQEDSVETKEGDSGTMTMLEDARLPTPSSGWLVLVLLLLLLPVVPTKTASLSSLSSKIV